MNRPVIKFSRRNTASIIKSIDASDERSGIIVKYLDTLKDLVNVYTINGGVEVDVFYEGETKPTDGTWSYDSNITSVVVKTKDVIQDLRLSKYCLRQLSYAEMNDGHLQYLDGYAFKELMQELDYVLGISIYEI
jgi:hypothetical protein